MSALKTPELSASKKIGLALLTVATLVACGPSPAVSARATELALGSLENQPRQEAAATLAPESLLTKNTAEAGDSIWGMVAENFKVTGDELRLFANFGTFWQGERNGSVSPIAWFTTKGALEMSSGIPGMLPDLWIGDQVFSGKTGEVKEYVEDNGFRGDRGMMVIRSDQVVKDDGSIENQVYVEGGDYGSGVTFRFVLDGQPEDNVWEVETSEGNWVSAVKITSLMRDQGINFYEAKQQFQASQSANN